MAHFSTCAHRSVKLSMPADEFKDRPNGSMARLCSMSAARPIIRYCCCLESWSCSTARELVISIVLNWLFSLPAAARELVQQPREPPLGHKGQTEKLNKIVRLNHLQSDRIGGQFLARFKHQVPDGQDDSVIAV